MLVCMRIAFYWNPAAVQAWRRYQARRSFPAQPAANILLQGPRIGAEKPAELHASKAAKRSAPPTRGIGPGGELKTRELQGSAERRPLHCARCFPAPLATGESYKCRSWGLLAPLPGRALSTKKGLLLRVAPCGEVAWSGSGRPAISGLAPTAASVSISSWLVLEPAMSKSVSVKNENK